MKSEVKEDVGSAKGSTSWSGTYIVASFTNQGLGPEQYNNFKVCALCMCYLVEQGVSLYIPNQRNQDSRIHFDNEKNVPSNPNQEHPKNQLKGLILLFLKVGSSLHFYLHSNSI